MTDCFVYGGLAADAALRDLLLGRAVAVQNARLTGHVLHRAEDQPFALPVARTDAATEGLLLRGLTGADLARLEIYPGGLGFRAQPMTVETTDGPVPALVWMPEAGRWQAGGAWDSAEWQRDWQPTLLATLTDVLELAGQGRAGAAMRRFGQMMVRGGSRVRAAEPSPATLRHDARPGDVNVVRHDQPYAHFFAVEEYDLSFRRFDGSASPVINRAAFISGDAVTVLPYDPLRDRVLLVEQFRAGPYARGDAQPWLIEAVAGRIDAGETPEQAARREAVEEAGLTLGALLPVGGYYPSPGAKTEYLYSYVALTDLPDGSAGIFGMEDEAEDIRGHLLAFDRMMELVASGEICNAPLMLTALWLQRERPALRAAAKG